jgi:hypothetical protein
MRLPIALVCVASAAFLTACQSSNKTADKPAATATARVVTVNTVCPIGGDEFGSAPSATRTYKGTAVGFCCDHCTAKFDTMSDAEKENVVNLAKANKVLAH